MDSRKRTILKATLWNLMGLATMALVGFLATGSIATGSGIAAVNTLVGFVSYVIYERFWSRISWGRHV